MEKAILKTLIYADIFDYPLTIFEIHKWLIGEKATLRQVEKVLGKMHQVSSIKYYGGYYFLPGRDELVAKRLTRRRQSIVHLRKAKVLTSFLKVIPWIKLVGISGGLAMDNAGKLDDIDLFIVTSKNRLWLARLLALNLLSLTGQRRKVNDFGRKIAGKLCLNILLEEDRLEQSNKDIYLAHEVLQMRVLWQRDGVYSKYLLDNEWAFRFLPNWINSSNQVVSSKYNVARGNTKKSHTTNYIPHSTLDFIETLVKKFQLWYMRKPQGMERIEDGALYFHPNDRRPAVLQNYKMKISHIFGTP